MSVEKTEAVRGTIGQWERDVVRRHVLGRFGDMLHATTKHPAMLAYLDNDSSLGPNSPVGLDWGMGYNENLAREILELHTVGSCGGYSEADVTSFAKMLTGWSYIRAWEADNGWDGGTYQTRGRFIYRDDWHEPGSYTLMGKAVTAAGQQQVEDTLDELAVHPSTAEHIAFKLVRHFITDRPTPAMVDPIEAEIPADRGDLRRLRWRCSPCPRPGRRRSANCVPPTNIPSRNIVRSACATKTASLGCFRSAAGVGSNAWEARSPEGYSDETPTWLNPDAMRIRLNIGQFINQTFVPNTRKNMPKLADSLFGAALSNATRTRLASAANSNAALTILFSCPEFQQGNGRDRQE